MLPASTNSCAGSNNLHSLHPQQAHPTQKLRYSRSTPHRAALQRWAPLGHLKRYRRRLLQDPTPPPSNQQPLPSAEGETLDRAEQGFSIILPADIALDTFGDGIRISRLASVYQANRKPLLIYNSTAAPNGITPSVNLSTYKGSTPRVIQFGGICLPYISIHC